MNSQQYKERIRALKTELSGFFKRQGFSLVLFLCLAVVGIAGAVAFLPKSEPAPTPTPMAANASSSRDQTLETAARPTPAATPPAAPTASPAPSPVPTPKPDNRAASPVSGTVLFGYAVDSLLYSPTLESWTTHPGVDLAAKAGEEVHVIRGGTVLDVSKDYALGVTVRVSHENGLVSEYANLKEAPPVTAGAKLSAGDVVGYVGDTAIVECALEPHLHFALSRDGMPVDPAEEVLLIKEGEPQ